MRVKNNQCNGIYGIIKRKNASCQRLRYGKQGYKEGTLSCFINCLRDVLQMNGAMFQQLIYGIKIKGNTFFGSTRRQMLLWDLQNWSLMVRTGELNWQCSSTAFFLLNGSKTVFKPVSIKFCEIVLLRSTWYLTDAKSEGRDEKINWNYHKNVRFFNSRLAVVRLTWRLFCRGFSKHIMFVI